MKKTVIKIAIIAIAAIIYSCSSAPNIKDTGAVDKYLQSHTFSNSAEGKISFGSGTYQLYSTGDKSQIYILHGETYQKACDDHDWWYLHKSGAVYHQMYDNLTVYTKD